VVGSTALVGGENLQPTQLFLRFGKYAPNLPTRPSILPLRPANFFGIPLKNFLPYADPPTSLFMWPHSLTSIIVCVLMALNAAAPTSTPAPNEDLLPQSSSTLSPTSPVFPDPRLSPSAPVFQPTLVTERVRNSAPTDVISLEFDETSSEVLTDTTSNAETLSGESPPDDGYRSSDREHTDDDDLFAVAPSPTTIDNHPANTVVYDSEASSAEPTPLRLPQRLLPTSARVAVAPPVTNVLTDHPPIRQSRRKPATTTRFDPGLPNRHSQLEFDATSDPVMTRSRTPRNLMKWFPPGPVR